MRLNAHNLRFLNEKGTPFEDCTVEPSLLYGIKAISFTTLTESQQVEPSAHTHLYISGNLLNLPLELGQLVESWSSKNTRSTRKGFGQMFLEEFFSLSLWWECKKLMVEEVLTFEVWFGRGVHGNPGIDPPTQTARADPKTGRLDAGDGRRWVSATKNQLRRVEWQVFFIKTRYTWSDWWNPWEKVHQYSDEGLVVFG